MGSFKRALLGYRREEVDAALAAREARISALKRDAEDADGKLRDAVESVARAEQEMAGLSGMVIEREREIRTLKERLQDANERHTRSIGSLQSIAASLEEVQAQARGQATRIRMKALREAVEVSQRTQELADAHPVETGGAVEGPSDGPEAGEAPTLFEGQVHLEIGPLGDFSQLVGFEDAVGQLGVSDISVERFSEGRATLSMHLDEPVELLRELEERAPMEFRVRRTSGDNVVLDVDEDTGPDQQAA